jgi:ATP-dependent helicase/DNAse subunit B
MPLTLLTGPANAGKAEVLMDALRREIAHGAEPLLVVPTRADAEHYLRELAGAGAVIGVRVERFAGLVELIAARAGLHEPPLGRLAREQLLDRVAAGADGSPRVAGLAHALGGVLRELQVRRVGAARLREAVAGASLRGVGGELPRLLEAYRDALAGIGRLDAEERATRSLDRLRRTPASWGAQPVLVYGFDDLAPLQLDVIETLATVVDAAVTVALNYEPGRAAFAGRASTFHALAPLAAEHRALPARADHYASGSREALSHLERSLLEPDSDRVDPGDAVRLLEGGGERAELELVAAEVRRLLDGGMTAEEIAVVLRASSATAALLQEVFTAAGVPVAMPRQRPFAATAVGAALIGLLRCACKTPGRAGEAGDLLAWLRAPGLLVREELADRLELRLRRAGATTAEQARALWEERNWPLESIDRLREAAASPAPARALLERASRELQWLFSAPRRGVADVLAGEQADEARALAAGRRALAELRELAARDPALAPAEPGELADVLAALQFPAGERPGPGTVAVLDPLGLRARRVRALFLCGLQEGVFPAPPAPPPFLSEEERRALAQAGLVLGEQRDALAAERYLLYAVVSRPEELLFLSWHLADDDGEPTARSLFVEDVCDLFTPALAQGLTTRPLGALTAPAATAAQPPAGLRALGDEQVLEDLRTRPWSASSLETWASCPARWFVERLLRPREFDPEAEPLARGALAHAVLRDVFAGLREETGSARPRAAELPRARLLLRQALDRHQAARPLSVAPERLAAARRRLQRDLERYLEHAAAEDSSLEPRHLELAFGFEGEDGQGEGTLPALDLGEGIALRGRIDRVDVGPGGEAIVYDYKNRRVAAPDRWVGEASLQLPLYMRAAEELLDVEAVGGFYQPLSGEDLRPRGVLDAASAVELRCVRGDVREREQMDELLAEVLAIARAAAREAAAGALESRPATCGFGGRGCMYPGVCRLER